MIHPFLKQYHTVAVPALRAKFGYPNVMVVPRVTKVVANIGLSASNKDQKVAEAAELALARITGQKPVKTLAKKSIASFKIRKNMVVGLKVTLRGRRMYDFLYKLVRLTLPRVRDFRGLSPSILDGHGNASIGFREYLAFPEVKSSEIERTHGIEIAIATTAKTNEEALELFRQLGFPFKRE